jgi:hypothetical protein
MESVEKNRKLILRFYKTISGSAKSSEILNHYTSDPVLIENVLFFEKLFPKHELIVDEITCEENRVIVRGRAKGKHTGEAAGIPPTFRVIETPFVIGYRVENWLIVDHWYITNQMDLLEQLGLTNSHT